MRAKAKQIDPYDHVADLVVRLGGVNAAARYAGVTASAISRQVNRKRGISLPIMEKLEEAARLHERRIGCAVLMPLVPYPRERKVRTCA